MNNYLISYRGKDGCTCLDLQRAKTLLDAMCAHFFSFPHSRYQLVREIR